MPIVYLGLGSNLGNRIENLHSAIKGLGPEVRAIRCSPIYETPPWGYENQPAFLNQVVLVESELVPGDLLKHIKRVEREIGRKETFRYGPRSIDIDILFYDDLVVDSPPLIIPHSRIPERAFVLIPMADLSPGYLHPVLGESIKSLLDKVKKDGIEYYSSAGCPGEDV